MQVQRISKQKPELQVLIADIFRENTIYFLRKKTDFLVS